MPKQKKKKRKSPTVSVAPLYDEDVGFEGLKKKRVSKNNELSFQVVVDEDEESKRRRRMQRFEEHHVRELSSEDSFLKELPTKRVMKAKAIFNRKTNNKLVGTSTALEKSYMRLTTAPKASDVRPLEVLKMALSHVKKHFIENEDFDFANEQMKSTYGIVRKREVSNECLISLDELTTSCDFFRQLAKGIRQDITVQHLRNNFVLEVYETHSRILLEHGDLNEFNQCQTMIRSLTSLEGSNGMITTKTSKRNVLRQSKKTEDEFLAYRLLYDVVQNSWCDLKVNIASEKISMDTSKSRTTDERNQVSITRGSSVRHALKVVKAIIHDDYIKFFTLYESAPHMSAYLMDYLVRRVRNRAFATLMNAYRPTISAERIREILSFRDLEEARQFLKKKGAIFLNDRENPSFWVDCKATYLSYLKSNN